MSRYIDAEKIHYINNTEVTTRRIIDMVPTADVAEVKHGRWLKIEKQPHLMRCSVCGSTSVEGNLNYCPRCGAKMDEVEE